MKPNQEQRKTITTTTTAKAYYQGYKYTHTHTHHNGASTFTQNDAIISQKRNNTTANTWFGMDLNTHTHTQSLYFIQLLVV